MTHRQKKLIIALLIIIVMVTIAIGTYLIFFRKADTTLRVKRLGGEEIVGHKVSQFSKSSLDIYPYGAFELKLIRTIGKDESTTIFVGIGTYTKTKKEYTFTYTDCYNIIGTEFEQRENFMGELNKKTYKIEKNGRIRFDYQGILYYFGH